MVSSAAKAIESRYSSPFGKPASDGPTGMPASPAPQGIETPHTSRKSPISVLRNVLALVSDLTPLSLNVISPQEFAICPGQNL